MVVKKYGISALIFSFIALLSTEAFAFIDGYIGAKAMGTGNVLSVGTGLSGSAEDSFTTGYGVGGVAGMRLTIIPIFNIRAEVEYMHIRLDNDFTKGVSSNVDFSSNRILANAYVDFDLIPFFKPYASVGVGVGFNDLKYTHTGVSRKVTSTDPVFQAGIGAYVKVLMFAVDLNVRYVHTTIDSATYTAGAGSRTYKASPHSVEGVVSLMLFF